MLTSEKLREIVHYDPITDHADGNGKNNAWINLRDATHLENGQNQPKRSTNTSGKHGVSWSKLHSRWESYIWFNGVKKHLGLFEDVEKAGVAYLNAKNNIHLFQPVPRDLVLVV